MGRPARLNSISTEGASRSAGATDSPAVTTIRHYLRAKGDEADYMAWHMERSADGVCLLGLSIASFVLYATRNREDVQAVEWSVMEAVDVIIRHQLDESAQIPIEVHVHIADGIHTAAVGDPGINFSKYLDTIGKEKGNVSDIERPATLPTAESLMNDVRYYSEKGHAVWIMRRKGNGASLEIGNPAKGILATLGLC